MAGALAGPWRSGVSRGGSLSSRGDGVSLRLGACAFQQQSTHVLLFFQKRVEGYLSLCLGHCPAAESVAGMRGTAQVTPPLPLASFPRTGTGQGWHEARGPAGRREHS